MENRLNRPLHISLLCMHLIAACLASVCIQCVAVSFAQQAPVLPNQNPAFPSSSSGLTSSDYLRLMEQSNAARGITVAEGNFPGAKPIPQSKSDHRAGVDQRAVNTNLPVPTAATFPSAIPPSANHFSATPTASTPPVPAQNISGPYVYADRSPTTPVPLLTGPAGSPGDRPISTPGNAPQGVVIPSPPASPVSPYVSAHTMDLLNNPSSELIGSGLVPNPLLNTHPQQYSSQEYSSQPYNSRSYGTQSSMPNALGGNRPSASLPSQSVRAPAPSGPRWIAGYETVWLNRAGDESTTFSQSGELGTFGVDQASRVSLAWRRDAMEYYEFAFLGSFVWNRSLISEPSIAPVVSQLQGSPSEPNWLTNMNGASSHTQVQQANLRSYELNKRWITDDLGNYFFGLNVIDYSEQFRFESVRNGNTGSMGIDTTNVMAGLQGGIELWRPISQRIALGGNGLTGLYGNFAHGDWRMDSGAGSSFATSADQFRIAGTLGLGARARYQFSSHCWAYGGYQWWYLAGLATVDNQPIGEVSSTATLDMTTNAGILLHGASCGLEFRF